MLQQTQVICVYVCIFMQIHVFVCIPVENCHCLVFCLYVIENSVRRNGNLGMVTTTILVVSHKQCLTNTRIKIGIRYIYSQSSVKTCTDLYVPKDWKQFPFTRRIQPDGLRCSVLDKGRGEVCAVGMGQYLPQASVYGSQKLLYAAQPDIQNTEA